ncbi:hypothetical protein Tco_1466237 [Tanacetum coccineum]
MAAIEVPRTLEYKVGQLNAALVLEVENFTNWKKRFMCHILDDQMNSVVNCLTAKPTWDDMILYHEGPSDVKEKMKWLVFCKVSQKTQIMVKESELASLIDIQDSPDDEEDTRSNHEYLDDLEEEYQERALLAKSKRFFKKGTQRSKAVPSDFEAKYNKVKAKLALLSSSASASKAATVKNKGLITEAYECDEEEVSSNTTKWWKLKYSCTAEENDDCIIEKIPSQKKRILGVDQITEDSSSSGQKDIVFVKSSANDTKVSIPGVERPWLSEAEGFILPNHDTRRILPAESTKNHN